MGSNQGVDVNDSPFHSLPPEGVRAIIPGENHQRCLDELAAAGIEPDRIEVLEGDEGLAILDTSGHHHGIKGWIARLTQAGGTEGNELAIAEAALRDGKLLMHVAIEDSGEIDAETLAVARILIDNGGDRVLRYGSGGTELLD